VGGGGGGRGGRKKELGAIKEGKSVRGEGHWRNLSKVFRNLKTSKKNLESTEGIKLHNQKCQGLATQCRRKGRSMRNKEGQPSILKDAAGVHICLLST